MAGTTNHEFEAHKRKIADLTRAAEWIAHTRADTIDAQPDVYLLDTVERLAGRLGQGEQINVWSALRCMAHKLTGINYGHPSTDVQSAVIGRLFTGIMMGDYLRDNPEQVFAGLGPVS